MQPQSRRRLFFWSLVVAAALAAASYFTPAAKVDELQAARMQLAREHVPKVLAALSHDPELRDVSATPSTGSGGCLLIGGDLKDAGKLSRVKSIVDATNPPVTVEYLMMMDANELHAPRSR